MHCTVIDARLKKKVRGTVFIQSIETQRYVEMLLCLLERHGLRCLLNSKARFSTTRDRMQKTGRRQPERFQIK